MQHVADRDINLNTINIALQKLAAGQSPEVKQFIHQKSEALKALDNRITDLFRLKASTLKDIPDAKVAVTAHQMKLMYGLIQEEIIRIGNDLVAAELDDIRQVGHDTLLLGSHMPVFKLDSGMRLLYGYCQAFGGMSVQIGQSHLPNIGIYIRDGKVQESEGICAGLQHEWAEESVQLGTPRYPITGAMQVLQKHSRQKVWKQEQYIWPIQASSQFNCDIYLHFNEMMLNVPYLVAITGDGGHAIGVRKHEHSIEIYDPNFGYFFLPTVAAAADMFTLIMNAYHANNINFSRISMAAYGAFDEGYVIPPNTFVSEKTMHECMNQSLSQPGYDKLVTQLRRQLVLMIKYTDEPTRIKTIMHHIMTVAKYLHQQELDELKALLQTALERRLPRDEEQVKKYLSSDAIYQSFVKSITKQDNQLLQDTLDYLQLVVPRVGLSAEAEQCMTQIQNAFALCMRQAYEYSAEMHTELNQKDKTKIDKSKVTELELKREILGMRLTLLRRANIPNQLVDGFLGKSAYTLEDARAAINRLQLDKYEEPDLEPHLTILKKLEQLKTYLPTSALPEFIAIRHKVLNSSDLAEVSKELYTGVFVKFFDANHNVIMPNNPTIEIVDAEIKVKFLVDLGRERKRIAQTMYGKPELRDGKIAALLELSKWVNASKATELNDIIKAFAETSHAKIINTHRRTGILSIFNPAKTTSQQLLDRYEQLTSKTTPSQRGL